MATELPLLATPEELAKRTNREPSDPDLEAELRAASNRFRDQVRRTISRVEDDEITLDGGGRRNLRLPSAPVTAISEVTIDGDPTEVSFSRDGLIRRKDGALFPDDYGNISVTYTHGFDPVPEEIAEAVLDSAEGRLATERGLSSLQVGGITQSFSKAEQAGVSQTWSDTVARWRIQAGGRA